MKKVVAILMLGVFLFGAALAGVSNVTDTGESGSNVHVMEKVYTFEEPQIKSSDGYTIVSLGGTRSIMDEGKPILPYKVDVIRFPLGTKVEVKAENGMVYEKQLESNETLKKTSSLQHKPEIGISQEDFPAPRKGGSTEASPQAKSCGYVLNEKEFRKKMDQLILEIKIRDKKLKEKEREIEALRKRLEILEQQNMPPFVESWGVDGSYGEEEIKQLQDRVKRWEIIWQKMKPLFGRDPKFKTLFILQRLGSISIRNLSQALGLDTNYTTTILRELQESGFVRVEGTIVRINTGL